MTLKLADLLFTSEQNTEGVFFFFPFLPESMCLLSLAAGCKDIKSEVQAALTLPNE